MDIIILLEFLKAYWLLVLFAIILLFLIMYNIIHFAVRSGVYRALENYFDDYIIDVNLKNRNVNNDHANVNSNIDIENK